MNTMPIVDGDIVVAVDTTTGTLTTTVVGPNMSATVRPVAMGTIGMLTLEQISQVAGDGFLEPTAFYETAYVLPSEDWGVAPYIIGGGRDGFLEYSYVPTMELNRDLDYQVLVGSGQGQSMLTGQPIRTRGGGTTGRGGGGGGEGEGDADTGQGEGGGEDQGPKPFPAPIDSMTQGEGKEGQGQGQGESQGEGEGQGEGEQQGSPSGSGQNEGPSQGQGEGEGQGQGQGEGDGKSQGQPSGSGQNQGPSMDGGESGDSAGQGQGQGEGSGEGSGDGEPSGSGQGQPTPSNQSGSASGSTQRDDEALLEQLEQEQAMRESEQSGSQPSPTSPPSEGKDGSGEGGEDCEECNDPKEITQDPDDFMDEDKDPEKSDGYDDIFDESIDFDEDDEPLSPPTDASEFMDDPPPMDIGPVGPIESDPNRPFQELSDEDLQRLIDELKRKKESPPPSPSPSPSSPGPLPSDTPLPDVGPNTPDISGELPDENYDPELDIPTGPVWLWINLQSGQLENMSNRPEGPWVHCLYILDREGNNTTFVMTFDDLPSYLAREGLTLDSYNRFQATPSMMRLEFSDAENMGLAMSSLEQGVSGQYMEWSVDIPSLTIDMRYIASVTDDGPEARWVSVGANEDVSSTSTEQMQEEARAMLERINEENQIANDMGIPTGYGEGSTSPYVPETESNAYRNDKAKEAGLEAGKGAANEARLGASRETDSARRAAQEASRQARDASDLESALGATTSAIENAARANANANPDSEDDMFNRNQALEAARTAIRETEEMLDESDSQVAQMLDDANGQLDSLNAGEGTTEAQELANQAEFSRNMTMEEEDPADKEMWANDAVRSAQEARNAAVEGDNKDRQAVVKAKTMAEQAIDEAIENGADMSAAVEALENIPDFNNLGELAEEAEARKRDTMPGEFANVENPDIEEDMLNVARRATEIAEEAMEQANPANAEDMATAEYIKNEANTAIDNVEGSWGGDPEEMEELRNRVQEAVGELDRASESMAAVWNTDSMTWYRGTDGEIYIFEDSSNALSFALENGLMFEGDLPPDIYEEAIRTQGKPIGKGGRLK